MDRKQERGRNRKERRKNEGRTSHGESETIVEEAEGEETLSKKMWEF